MMGNFPNRAGIDTRNDQILKDELESAGIRVIQLPVPMNAEVRTRVYGEIGGWTFFRQWYYWSADGPGIPLEAAEELHKKHGRAQPAEHDQARSWGLLLDLPRMRGQTIFHGAGGDVLMAPKKCPPPPEEWICQNFRICPDKECWIAKPVQYRPSNSPCFHLAIYPVRVGSPRREVCFTCWGDRRIWIWNGKYREKKICPDCPKGG